ncbi:unnamed protein product [Merluccius merluccius]
MAANIEQIFQDFILNKIREIEDQQEDNGPVKALASDAAATAAAAAAAAARTGADSEREDKEEDGQGAALKKHKKHKKHKSKKSKKKKRKRDKDEKESSSESGGESDAEAKRRSSDRARKKTDGNRKAGRHKQHLTGKKKKKKRRKEDGRSSSDSDSDGSRVPGSSVRRQEDLPDIIPKQVNHAGEFTRLSRLHTQDSSKTGGADAGRDGARTRSRSRSARRAHRSRSRSRSARRVHRSRSRSRSARRVHRSRSRSRSARRTHRSRSRSRSARRARRSRSARRTHRSRSRSRRRRSRSRSCSRSRRRRTRSTSRSRSQFDRRSKRTKSRSRSPRRSPRTRRSRTRSGSESRGSPDRKPPAEPAPAEPAPAELAPAEPAPGSAAPSHVLVGEAVIALLPNGQTAKRRCFTETESIATTSTVPAGSVDSDHNDRLSEKPNPAAASADGNESESRSSTKKKKKRTSKSPQKKKEGKSSSSKKGSKRRSRSHSQSHRRSSRSGSRARRKRSGSGSKRKRSGSRGKRSVSRGKRSVSRRKRSGSRRRRSVSRGKRSRSRGKRSGSRGKRRSRSRSGSRAPRRGAYGGGFSQRDRWKREPSRSPVLILRKNRSPAPKHGGDAKSPPRITELDKEQLLEIAKANAAAMCTKAGVPVPDSLKPRLTTQLPLPLPLPNMAMNAAVASMTAATMTAALSSMGALASLPPLPSISNKPPPGLPQPNMAVLEEVKKKVTKQANSISIKEFTDKCKMIVDSKGELPVAKPHVSDEEDEGKPFGSAALREQKAISFSINNMSVRPAVRSDAGIAKEFPVSSGSQHRKKEGEAPGAYGEWVPVEKMSDKAAKAVAAAAAVIKAAASATSAPAVSSPAATQPPAVTPAAAPQPAAAAVPASDSVFPEPPLQPVDISQAVTERITAQRRLAENPYDVSAICMLSRAQEQVDAWAQSNSIPGLFTGSTGAQVLSSEELSSSGPQAWLKKDQFLRAAPVSGGVGEFLMRKMGWKTGEGLGRNREGTVEPIVIDFKIDRKGLVAEGEKPQKQTGGLVVTKDLMGKHPVSALIELCNKKRIMQPDFVMVHHSGPDHRKNFLFKVTVNSVDYQPQTASPNKKHAKAMAAMVALQGLGEVPADGPGLYTGPVFTAASTGPLFST